MARVKVNGAVREGLGRRFDTPQAYPGLSLSKAHRKWLSNF